MRENPKSSSCWTFVPGGVDLLSGKESVTSGESPTTEPLSASSKTCTAGGCFDSECETESSGKQPSTQTCARLTQDLGLESFRESLVDSHVPPGQQEDESSTSTITETCGPMSYQYYGTWGQPWISASLKMSHSFVELPITPLSSPTWHPSGLMLYGKIGQLPAWGATIGGRDGGYTPGDRLPTPQASDNRDRGHLGNPSVQRRLRLGKQLSLGQVADPERKSGCLSVGFVSWMMGWIPGWTSLSPLKQEDIDDFYRKMEDGSWWVKEPDGPRVGPKCKYHQEQLTILGNGMVPLCLAVAHAELKKNALLFEADYWKRKEGGE